LSVGACLPPAGFSSRIYQAQSRGLQFTSPRRSKGHRDSSAPAGALNQFFTSLSGRELVPANGVQRREDARTPHSLRAPRRLDGRQPSFVRRGKSSSPGTPLKHRGVPCPLATHKMRTRPPHPPLP
jgi:hypothetical protein